MNEIIQILLTNYVLLVACMAVLWLISIAIGDVSFVDIFWAAGFVLIAASTWLQTGDPDNPRQMLLLGLTAVWGIRLALYLFLRWRREGPDGRYVALLKKSSSPHMTSLTKVFGLQSIMLWIVSLPVQLGQIGNTPLGILALAGSLLAVIGILFETVGDHQLAVFKANPDNAGKVMDTGLWRYTRHPNYFGDCCVWWGLFLIAAETGLGAWSIFGPLLLTWTLLKWSGAALLERRLRRSRPEYQSYLERTSSFFPWPPSAPGSER